MEFVDDALSILDKIRTLVTSRRFALALAGAVWALLVLVQLIAPAIGVELDTSGMPTEEAVAARIEHGVTQLGAFLSALGVVATMVWGIIRPLVDSYTTRPPGYDKPKLE